MFTTLVGTVKCTKGPLHTLHLCIGLHGYSLIVIIIEGGAYSVFKKSACLILWPDEVSTFLGEVTKVLQIQMENDFFSFLNPGDGHNNLLQSPTIKCPATVH